LFCWDQQGALIVVIFIVKEAINNFSPRISCCKQRNKSRKSPTEKVTVDKTTILVVGCANMGAALAGD
jgi:hypothetical protein